METEMKDFGMMNGWKDDTEEAKEREEILDACKFKGHQISVIGVGHCLSEYICHECNYKYTVDSSD